MRKKITRLETAPTEFMRLYMQRDLAFLKGQYQDADLQAKLATFTELEDDIDNLVAEMENVRGTKDLDTQTMDSESSELED